MKDDAVINDRQYWDGRFRQDWEAMAGPKQSRFFAALSLQHLPEWLLRLARRERLTVADWGCAQGDGTELLAGCLAPGCVAGIDFSTAAIEQARSRYPGLRFSAADWLVEDGGERYDIVFSSNTLEHFHDPLAVLNRVAARADKAVLLALPYRELDRHPEHFFSFLPQNIPLVLENGFRLAWARVVDCRPLPDTSWPGEQVFLAYVAPGWADAKMGLSLQDGHIESGTTVTVAELRQAQAEAATLAATLQQRESELAGSRAETRQAQVEQALAAAARSQSDGELAAVRAELRVTQGELANAVALLEQRARDAALRAGEYEQEIRRVSAAHQQTAADFANMEALRMQAVQEQTRLQAELAELRQQQGGEGERLAQKDAELEQLRRLRESEIEELRQLNLAEVEELARRKESELAEARRQQEEAVEEARRTRELQAAELRRVQDAGLAQVDELRRRKDAEIEELRRRKDGDIEELKRRMEAQAGRLRLQKDAEIEELRRATDAELQELRALRDAEIEDLRRLKDNEIVLVHQLKNAEIEDLRRVKDAEIAELRRLKDADVEQVNQQKATLHAELQARSQELRRVSDWASNIAAHPGTYALKRNSYLVVRELYRRFPMPQQGKQKLKNLAYRIGHRGLMPPAAQGAEPVNQATQEVLAAAPGAIVPFSGPRDVFVFAVIDWHFRIQRPQHLARGIAGAGRRVFYISNNFVDSEEPGYALERLDPKLELFQVKLHVKGAPPIYFAAATPEVRRMLQASLARLMVDFGALSTISLVQHAFWYPLVRSLPNTLRVYDCMDHHEGFGNVPVELVQAEQEMLRQSDLVVVTSSWLEDFASSYNRSIAVVRNAVEYGFFAAAPAEVYRDEQGRRIIGYFGAIAEWFDIELVRRIARAHPDCLVLLVGNDTVNAGRQLQDEPNVKFTGEVPYKQLTHYLYAFDVCLLPFQVTPLTLATNPVKVYEYLASGKPVVCVDLPEVQQFGNHVYKGSHHADFVAKVDQALGETRNKKVVAARRAFAAEQTWAHRAERFQKAIANLALPKVSVVVLTYNNLDLTKACLASVLRESDYPNLELIVVDNASTDGSPEWLRDFGRRNPGARVILNDRNLGFSAGNNVGLAAATGDYLVILNNDTVVTRGWVLTMLRHLQDNPAIGIVGPITNNIGNAARMETQYKDIAAMPDEAVRLTLPNMGVNFPIQTTAFFCVMFHRSVYEAVGPMCEEFGRGFFEDDDYCRRIERLGLRVICAEDVFIHHHLSASFNKLPSAEKQALFERNKATYEAKWGQWVPHTYSREYTPTAGDPLAAAGEGGAGFLAGHCTVCGHRARFFFRPGDGLRDGLACDHCSATSRQRSVAWGILCALKARTSVHADSLASLPRVGVDKPLKMSLDGSGALAPLLQRTGWIEVVGQSASSVDILVAPESGDGHSLKDSQVDAAQRALAGNGVLLVPVSAAAAPEEVKRLEARGFAVVQLGDLPDQGVLHAPLLYGGPAHA